MIRVEFHEPQKVLVRRTDESNQFNWKEDFSTFVICKSISHSDGFILIKLNDDINFKLKAGKIIKSITNCSLT